MNSLVTVRAPAKVNLYLAVGPKRPDGFHELATVYQAVSLYDDITARSARGISLHFDGLGAALPTDETNLAYRAARAVADAAGIDTDETGADVHITKRIPIAGGMAGGSADAAGTLVACNELWGAGLSEEKLLELGTELGSDVPFCLAGGTASGQGRGERITPVMARGTFTYLIATMKHGLSTPKVYAAFDKQIRGRFSTPTVSPAFMAALAQGDTQMAAYAGRNDLMTSALRMHRGARAVLEQFCLHSLTVMISGSGPTLMAQVDCVERGEVLAEQLRTRPEVGDAFVVTGPVPGARVTDRVPAPTGLRRPPVLPESAALKGTSEEIPGLVEDAGAGFNTRPAQPFLRVITSEEDAGGANRPDQ